MADIPQFRALYEAFMRYHGDDVFGDVILPWLPSARAAMVHLGRYGEVAAKALAADHVAPDLWNLYALSRLSDKMLLSFQPLRQPRVDRGPEVTLAEYREFMSALDMAELAEVTFHPFFHEIVAVRESPGPRDPPSIVRQSWPGFRLGHLLFSRAGVVVRAGREVIHPSVATRSTMYFTFSRGNRPCDDLSRGWGTNSQWRTESRRDYYDGSFFYYNVDGERPLGRGMNSLPTDDDLTLTERIELLRHRCFVRTVKPSGDRDPYHDCYVEPRLDLAGTG